MSETVDEELARLATPIKDDAEPCLTRQWNHPHDRTMPFASDGICSVCGQEVETVRVGPDDPCLYSHIAKPHTRPFTWYRIKEYDLRALLQYRRDW